MKSICTKHWRKLYRIFRGSERLQEAIKIGKKDDTIVLLSLIRNNCDALLKIIRKARGLKLSEDKARKKGLLHRHEN